MVALGLPACGWVWIWLGKMKLKEQEYRKRIGGRRAHSLAEALTTIPIVMQVLILALLKLVML